MPSAIHTHARRPRKIARPSLVRTAARKRSAALGMVALATGAGASGWRSLAGEGEDERGWEREGRRGRAGRAGEGAVRLGEGETSRRGRCSALTSSLSCGSAVNGTGASILRLPRCRVGVVTGVCRRRGDVWRDRGNDRSRGLSMSIGTTSSVSMSLRKVSCRARAGMTVWRGMDGCAKRCDCLRSYVLNT